MLTRIPAVNRYDLHCQHFSTMDNTTAQVGRNGSPSSRPGIPTSYCTYVRKLSRAAQITVFVVTCATTYVGIAAAGEPTAGVMSTPELATPARASPELASGTP